MFKIPDWELDVPETDAVFKKKVKNTKSKHESSDTNLCISPIENPKYDKKTKQNKVKLKKQKHICSTSEMRNDNIFNEGEGFEMDEILVNAKKKKLYDIYKKEDCEDLLFGDTKEANLEKTESNKHESKCEIVCNNIKDNFTKTPKKRKNNNSTNQEISKVIVNTKKIKMNDNYDDKTIENNNTNFVKNENKDSTAPGSNIAGVSEGKHNGHNFAKKDKFRKLLEQSHRRPITVKGNNLRDRMLERLKVAQFRYLNEKLYTSSGNEAQEIFKSDPTAFKTYHEGYQQQVKKWPVNPLDIIVKKIQNFPRSFVVADMGCGSAALSRRVPHAVHSFDLVAAAPGVCACDMARTPLARASVDVVVYCLALMGTGLTNYLVEANIKMKTGGHLLIAEVESRFEDVNTFVKSVERLGFRLKSVDQQHRVFFFFHFVKVGEPPAKRSKLPDVTLKPCLYKKR